jgi:magnesium chelatase family protein
MIGHILSASMLGLEGTLVEIEVDFTQGLPGITIVGLPDTAVNEAKERIRLALKNSNAKLPNKRVIINLAPAEVRKSGTLFDLPMAVGILRGLEIINFIEDNASLFVGELALDGSVRQVNGVLPITAFAKDKGIKNIFVPQENVGEASLVSGINVFGVKSLTDLVKHFDEKEEFGLVQAPMMEVKGQVFDSEQIDMNLIKGQEYAKRALEIAAAGGHNILMNGSPGSGKTLLSRTFTTILPPMDNDEILEVSQLYSIVGQLSSDRPLITTRPFRAPHHTASSSSLIGGGTFPRPGEISLAHRGVLFMDEFPEFPRFVLESLRQPLEDRLVTVSRVQGALTFPADFILVASQNPCPCGYLFDKDRPCVCSPSQVVKYKNKISGPLLDRIDMIITVDKVKTEDLIGREGVSSQAEASADIRKRVIQARLLQRERFVGTKLKTNSEMGPKQLKVYCILPQDAQDLLKIAVTKLGLSARAYSRILKLSRTIADLAGSDVIKTEYVAEALQYREREE